MSYEAAIEKRLEYLRDNKDSIPTMNLKAVRDYLARSRSLFGDLNVYFLRFTTYESFTHDGIRIMKAEVDDFITEAQARKDKVREEIERKEREAEAKRKEEKKKGKNK